MSVPRPAVATASHLSSGQIEQLRRLLVEEHVLQQTRAVELQDGVDLEPELADALLVRCREALDEIEAALALIDQGTYGACSECRSAIPYERLEIVPATSRCVSCQSDRDRTPRASA